MGRMDKVEIIKEIKTYEIWLAESIATWLKKRLPTITNKWWDDLVISSLTDMQKLNTTVRNDLGSLDLAALLRVVVCNWYSLASIEFLNDSYKYKTKDMIKIRNDWAHFTTQLMDKKRIIEDLEVIQRLLEFYGGSSEKINAIEQFILSLNSGTFIDYHDAAVKEEIAPIEITETKQIGLGSMVCLVADKTRMGSVVKIDGRKYTVFFGVKDQQVFYEEQIEIVADEVEDKQIKLADLHIALTAHQINNPSKSNLYSLNAAKIDFVPYQFRPALKLIKSEEQRILIADDVGVGKTIEAGLILKELQARADIKSVLIICPRSLVVDHKWKSEMQRFDEDFYELDGNILRNILEHYDGSWPDNFSKCIMSYSLFSERTLEGTEYYRGLLNLENPPKFDLVIVDEAHHIRNRNTLAYRGVEALVRDAGAVVFLSATPIQNSSDDLYTLLELLRNDIINSKDTYRNMAEPNEFVNKMLLAVRSMQDGWQEEVRHHMGKIMQTKYGYSVMQHNPRWETINNAINKREISLEEKINLISSIEELHTFAGIINRTRRRDIGSFCKRRTITVKNDFTDEQKRLYDALIRFETNALMALHGTSNVRFMMCTLMRQASSCLYGLAPFIKDIIDRRIESIKIDGYFDENDENLPNEYMVILDDLVKDVKLLMDNLPEEDPKFNKLYNEIIVPQVNKEQNKIIIFSSFKHTLQYILKKLTAKNYRVGMINGDVKDEERREISGRFKLPKDDANAIDILLFTEVGCEGLDYQFCDTLVNYDMPWNPMRIEQRIGRIDRRGQLSEAVKIYNMITDGTIDATIYDRCLNKIDVFKNSIGDCAEILGDINKQITEIMYAEGLTEAERAEKIEKLAENNVLRIKEMRKLEDESRALYGIDLESHVKDKAVQAAENEWISPEKMMRMLDTYLHNLFQDEKDKLPVSFFNEKNKKVTLQLTRSQRQQLLQVLKDAKIQNRTRTLIDWEKYLNGTERILAVTFESAVAKEDNSLHFFNQFHPIIIEASKCECRDLDCEIGLEVIDDNITAGKYPFMIYNWVFKGERDDIKLVPITDNEYLQQKIISMLHYARDFKFSSSDYEEDWKQLEDAHYDEWVKAKREFVDRVNADCKFRQEQEEQTWRARKEKREAQYQHISDINILNMNKGYYEKIEVEIEKIRKKYEKIASAADINIAMLIKGVVNVINS